MYGLIITGLFPIQIDYNLSFFFPAAGCIKSVRCSSYRVKNLIVLDFHEGSQWELH